MHTAPAVFQFSTDNTLTPFHLVRDPHVKYPGFERNLYCHLDYDILIMLIGYIIVIDNKTDNPMLAIFIAYIIERIFRLLRSFIG